MPRRPFGACRQRRLDDLKKVVVLPTMPNAVTDEELARIAASLGDAAAAPDEITTELRKLACYGVTLSMLTRFSDMVKRVKALRKHAHAEVARLASRLVQKWREENGVGAGKATQRGRSDPMAAAAPPFRRAAAAAKLQLKPTDIALPPRDGIDGTATTARGGGARAPPTPPVVAQAPPNVERRLVDLAEALGQPQLPERVRTLLRQTQWSMPHEEAVRAVREDSNVRSAILGGLVGASDLATARNATQLGQMASDALSACC